MLGDFDFAAVTAVYLQTPSCRRTTLDPGLPGAAPRDWTDKDSEAVEGLSRQLKVEDSQRFEKLS
jgi:hypothetical protein